MLLTNLKKTCTALLLFIFIAGKAYGQIAGSFTVPGSFPSLAAAINTLNITGVAGAVTINVMAGYTETVPVGGLTLINPVGSSTTTILFRKQGIGANPLLFAYAGGTAINGASVQDGIWKFVSCKNITVDGIDLLDQNTSYPATMEFGYAFFKTGLNGNQNNTIKNCVVTMGGNSSTESYAIEMTCSYYLNNTSCAATTTTLHTNSFNKFYNNLLQNCSIGIYMLGSSSNRDIANDIGGLSAATGNTISNYGSLSNSSAVYTENQTQFNASFNTINNNTGNWNTFASASGIVSNSVPEASINSNTISLYQPSIGIRHRGGNSLTGTVTVNNNVFPSLTFSSTILTPSIFAIYTESNNITTINNNQIAQVSTNSGTVNIIYAVGGGSIYIANNAIMGATISPDGGILQGISVLNGFAQINNNTIGNCQAQTTSNNVSAIIRGINSNNTYSVAVSSNTISNLTGADLSGIFLTSTVSSTSYSVVGNQLYNFGPVLSNTVGSSCSAIISNLANGSGVSMVRNNRINNFVAAGFSPGNVGGQIYGIIFNQGQNCFASQNKIYGLNSSGSSVVVGLYADASNSTIYNNLIGELQSPNGIVEAMRITGGTNRLYYNSVCLNNTVTTLNNSGANLISSLSGNPSIEARNNILINTSVSTGTGITSIFAGATPLSSSNRNAYYLGAASPNRQILYASPSTSVLLGYQTISNSDAQSFIENPPFVSTVGSNANFLNINPTVATQIEGGAAPITTITTDFANAVRSNTPDIGAWEGNFTMADASKPIILSSGFTSPPCDLNRTFTASISDASGVAGNTLAPRLYYRVNFGLYTSTQGTLTSGTINNGIWTFSFNPTAVTGDVIWHFLVYQDISYLNNIGILPATNATVTDVNTVQIPPSPAFNFTLQTYPTISATPATATICSNQTQSIQALGASNYTYLPGNSASVNPTTTTTYTIFGASSLGCPSTNTVNVTITTLPLPSVTVNSGSICTGQSFTLSPSGASSYTFSSGTAVVNPVNTTNYSVIGSNSQNTCVSVPAIATVTVYASNIGATSNTSQVCSGGTVVLNGTGGFNYVWSNSILNNTPFTPSVSSIYTVTGTSANGCIGNKTITIAVQQFPTLTITKERTYICVGETANLSASGAANYTWQPNSIVGNVYSFQLQSSTTVSLTGVNQFGCSADTSVFLFADFCIGIPETNSAALLISPNPCQGLLSVSLSQGTAGYSAKIVDLSGKCIYDAVLSSNRNQIDLSAFSNGIYKIEISLNTIPIHREKLVLISH